MRNWDELRGGLLLLIRINLAIRKRFSPPTRFQYSLLNGWIRRHKHENRAHQKSMHRFTVNAVSKSTRIIFKNSDLYLIFCSLFPSKRSKRAGRSLSERFIIDPSGMQWKECKGTSRAPPCTTCVQQSRSVRENYIKSY